MKKYVASILLITLLFFIFGYQLYFEFLQYEIRHEIEQEIEQGLNEEDLTLIVISAENEKKVHWIEKNKEFRYEGSMYDVVKTIIKGDKKFYYCINDIQEENLIANYARQNNRRRKALLRFRKILNNKYLPKNFSYNIKKRKAAIYFAEYCKDYNSIYLEILSPPPEV